MVRETSIEAYHEMMESGLISERRWQTLDALYAVRPATGGEVYQEFKRRYGQLAPTNSNITTRLGELREMDLAFETGTRECSVSGHEVTLWDVTGNLPKKILKPKRIPCENCDGSGYVQDWGF